MITVTMKVAAGFEKLLNGKTGEQQITVAEDSTLRELLDILIDQFGKDFRQAVYQDKQEELRRGLRLILNGRDIAVLGGLGAKLRDGDRISLLPVISGG